MQGVRQDLCRSLVQQAARDAGLAPPTEMSGGVGYEIPVSTDPRIQGKVVVLVTRDAGGPVRLTIRAFMFRQCDKRISISDSSDIATRGFARRNISPSWLRHYIALAAREVGQFCEPEHQERLRRAEIIRQKQK